MNKIFVCRRCSKIESLVSARGIPNYEQYYRPIEGTADSKPNWTGEIICQSCASILEKAEMIKKGNGILYFHRDHLLIDFYQNQIYFLFHTKRRQIYKHHKLPVIGIGRGLFIGPDNFIWSANRRKNSSAFDVIRTKEKAKETKNGISGEIRAAS